MIARHRSAVGLTLLFAACSDPAGVLKDAPAEPAFAKGGGTGGGVLLPTLGGAFADARAVNDAGVVVGASTDATGAMFAVRWTQTLSGSWSITKITADPASRAFAVNANGAAVGVRAGRGKLWPGGGSEIDLGLATPGGINSAESVVGYRIDPVLRETAVVWRKPTGGWSNLAENPSQDLPAFPGGTGQSQAFAINDAGVIGGSVGVSTVTSSFYAVQWDPSGDQWGPPSALPGTENFSSTTARAISDNSQPDFAGHVRACPQFCSAFGIFWPGGNSPSNLEPFFGDGSGMIEGLNNAQRAVGFRSDTRQGTRAFVWWPGQTSIQELRGSGGYSTTHAYDINNMSPAWAVGSAQGSNPSKSRAIVWAIP